MRLVEFASIVFRGFAPALCFAALVLPFTLPCQAGMILYDNPPDTVAVSGFNMATLRVADPFTLSAAATIGQIQFWNVNIVSGLTNQVSEVTWGIYSSTGSAPGTLLATGTSAVTSTLFQNEGFATFYQVDFTPTGIGLLGAGTYWLELHDGSSFTDGSQPFTNWAYGKNVGAQNYVDGPLNSSIPITPGMAVTGSGENDLALEIFDNSTAATPEPGTAGVILAGLAAGVIIRRKRMSSSKLPPPHPVRHL